MGCCMIDEIRFEPSHDFKHSVTVLHIGDDGFELDVPAETLELPADQVDAVFAVSEKDEPFRTEANQLPANLGTNRTTSTGDEDGRAMNASFDFRNIEFDRFSTE